MYLSIVSVKYISALPRPLMASGKPTTWTLSPLMKVCFHSKLYAGTFKIISALKGSWDLSNLRLNVTDSPSNSEEQVYVPQWSVTVHVRGKSSDITGVGQS